MLIKTRKWYNRHIISREKLMNIFLKVHRCIVTTIHRKSKPYIQNLHFKTYCWRIKIDIRLYQNISDMFQVTYIVHVFLIINILYNRTASCFESFYGLRTTDNPKTSCLKIANCWEMSGNMWDHNENYGHDQPRPI